MTTPLHELPTIKLCESCGASIFFVYTEQGGKAPLDARPSSSGSIRLELRSRDDGRGRRWVGIEEAPDQKPRFVAHFATCPEAAGFRKGRRNRKRASS